MSLEKDIEMMIESLDLKLYDILTTSEGEETIYRVNITSNSGGISMDNIVDATKLISPLLDVTPPVSGDYRLEVSSPGIERKLTNINHFKKSIGDKAVIHGAEKLKYRGEILSVDGSTIAINDDELGESKIEFNAITKARTFFEW